jgi:hypothetical protein
MQFDIKTFGGEEKVVVIDKITILETVKNEVLSGNGGLVRLNQHFPVSGYLCMKEDGTPIRVKMEQIIKIYQ